MLFQEDKESTPRYNIHVHAFFDKEVLYMEIVGISVHLYNKDIPFWMSYQSKRTCQASTPYVTSSFLDE